MQVLQNTVAYLHFTAVLSACAPVTIGAFVTLCTGKNLVKISHLPIVLKTCILRLTPYTPTETSP